LQPLVWQSQFGVKLLNYSAAASGFSTDDSNWELNEKLSVEINMMLCGCKQFSALSVPFFHRFV
jgi:hypothetical protein